LKVTQWRRWSKKYLGEENAIFPTDTANIRQKYDGGDYECTKFQFCFKNFPKMRVFAQNFVFLDEHFPSRKKNFRELFDSQNLERKQVLNPLPGSHWKMCNASATALSFHQSKLVSRQ